MSSNSFLFRHVRTLMFALTALPLVSHAAVETIAKGQLTYGTAATFMPFEYVKAGKLRYRPDQRAKQRDPTDAGANADGIQRAYSGAAG